jgi:hypothetical protein
MVVTHSTVPAYDNIPDGRRTDVKAAAHFVAKEKSQTSLASFFWQGLKDDYRTLTDLTGK